MSLLWLSKMSTDLGYFLSFYWFAFQCWTEISSKLRASFWRSGVSLVSLITVFSLSLPQFNDFTRLLMDSLLSCFLKGRLPLWVLGKTKSSKWCGWVNTNSNTHGFHECFLTRACLYSYLLNYSAAFLVVFHHNNLPSIIHCFPRQKALSHDFLFILL